MLILFQLTSIHQLQESKEDLQDSIIPESVGSSQPGTASVYFKALLYLPVIDKFIAEMNEQFNLSIILTGIATCSPSSSAFLKFEPFLSHVWDRCSHTRNRSCFVFPINCYSQQPYRHSTIQHLHSCLPAY